MPIFLLLVFTLTSLLLKAETEEVKDYANFSLSYDYQNNESKYSSFYGPQTYTDINQITNLNFSFKKNLDDGSLLIGDMFTFSQKRNGDSLFFPVNDNSGSGVRQLYLAKDMENGHSINLGRKEFAYKNFNSVQEQGYNYLPTTHCRFSGGLNNCISKDFISYLHHLSPSLNIELFKSKSIEKSEDINIKSYRIEKTFNENHKLTFTHKKSDSKYGSFFLTNRESMDLQLDFIDPQNQDSKWYVNYKKINNDKVACWRNIVNYGHDLLDNSSGIGGGYITKINKLKAHLNFTKNTINKYYILPFGNCSNLPVKKTSEDTISLIMEYPIENGKIISKHLFNPQFQSTSYGDAVLQSQTSIQPSRINEIEVLKEINSNFDLSFMYQQTSIKDYIKTNKSSLKLTYKF